MRNQCSGCSERFNSVYAFDAHRTGRFGVSRRCFTRDEMRARGMKLNAAGFWMTRPPRTETLQRLAHPGVGGSPTGTAPAACSALSALRRALPAHDRSIPGGVGVAGNATGPLGMDQKTRELRGASLVQPQHAKALTDD